MDQIHARRIVEALRFGVPTHDSVSALGSGQTRLEHQFEQLIRNVAINSTVSPPGFVFNGGFGTGKSHLLESLEAGAVRDGYVVSRATISKGLPLHETIRVVYDLITATKVSGFEEDFLMTRLDSALFDLNTDLSGLRRWTKQNVSEGRLAPIFLAIVSALQNVNEPTAKIKNNLARIVDYLSGATVTAPGIRLAIQQIAPHATDVRAPKAAERPWQTIAFLSRLFQTLGHRGWIVLFDELELMRLQGPVARAKAYAELARWFGLDDDTQINGLGVVGCITPDYFEAYIDAYSQLSPMCRDALEAPRKLLASVANAHLAPLAELGMTLIERQQTNACRQTVGADLEAVQARIKPIYEAAYNVTIPKHAVRKSDGKQGMRPVIRRWMLLWDLHRAGRAGDIKDYVVNAAYEESDDNDNDS
jgi:hypothetical protein